MVNNMVSLIREDPLHVYVNCNPPFIARLKNEALDTMKKISSILKNETFQAVAVAAAAAGVGAAAVVAAGVAAAGVAAGGEGIGAAVAAGAAGVVGAAVVGAGAAVAVAAAAAAVAVAAAAAGADVEVAGTVVAAGAVAAVGAVGAAVVGAAAGVAAAAAKAVGAKVGLGTLGAIGIIGIGSVIMIRALKKRNPELQKQAFFKAAIKNYIQELDEGEIGTEDEKTQRGFLDAVEASFPEPMEELNRYLVEEIIRSEIDVTERSIPQFLHSFLGSFRDLKTNYAALLDGEKQSFNIRGETDIGHQALNLAGEIQTGNVVGPRPQVSIPVSMFSSFSNAAKELKRELGF